MNEYELLYVVSPRLTADEAEGTAERVRGLIEDGGGEVLMADNWGRRRLAYPIGRHFEGTYVLKHLRLPPGAVAGFERALHISEDILRHLLVRGIVPDYGGPPDEEIAGPRRDARRAPRAAAPRPPDAAPPPATPEAAPRPPDAAPPPAAPEAAPPPAAPEPAAAPEAAPPSAAPEPAPAPEAEPVAAE